MATTLLAEGISWKGRDGCDLREDIQFLLVERGQPGTVQNVVLAMYLIEAAALLVLFGVLVSQ